jgi:hypothetical protein
MLLPLDVSCLPQSGGGDETKKEGIQQTKKCESKVVHDQYIRSIQKTAYWQKKRHIPMAVKGRHERRTENEIVAAQEQALQTKYYATKILQTETESNCRLCQQFDETVEHIISVCIILKQEQYIKRHDRVCAQLRLNMCKEIRVKLDNEHWYEHVPKSAETSKKGKGNHIMESTSANQQNNPQQ